MEPTNTGDCDGLPVASPAQDRVVAWVAQYGPALYRLAMALTRNRETAEDIVQEVLVRGWRTHQRHRDLLPAAWFYKVTRNLCVDYLRRETRRIQAEARGASFEASSSHVGNDAHVEAMAVKRAVGSLSERDQLCLWLFYYGDWSFKDIADALRISPATVKTRVARARQRLREQWKEGDDRHVR